MTGGKDTEPALEVAVWGATTLYPGANFEIGVRTTPWALLPEVNSDPGYRPGTGSTQREPKGGEDRA